MHAYCLKTPICAANTLFDNLRVPLSQHAEEILLDSNADLYPENQIDFVFFPVDSMVSVVRGDLEAATIGSEGMVGCTVLLGGHEPLGKHTVVIPGMALRVPVDHVLTAVRQQPETAAILNLYLSDFVAQILQVVECSHLHTVKQRCARWLLNAQDCAVSEELLITQERLADLLGVRRATINPLLVELRHEGSIGYSRGKLIIMDRQRLTDAACECYRLIATRRAKRVAS